MSAEITAHMLKLEQQNAEIQKELLVIRGLLQQSQAPAAIKRRGLTVKEACAETGLRSASAFYRWAKKNKVTPYAPGKFFLDAIQSAMARGGFRELRAKQNPAEGGVHTW